MRHFCVCHWAPLRAHSAVGGRARGYLARKTPIQRLSTDRAKSTPPCSTLQHWTQSFVRSMQGVCFHWFGSRSRAGFTVPTTRVHYHRAHTWRKLWSTSWNSQFLNKGPFTFILYYAWQVTRPVLSKCLVCSQMLTLSRWLFFQVLHPLTCYMY